MSSTAALPAGHAVRSCLLADGSLERPQSAPPDRDRTRSGEKCGGDLRPRRDDGRTGAKAKRSGAAGDANGTRPRNGGSIGGQAADSPAHSRVSTLWHGWTWSVLDSATSPAGRPASHRSLPTHPPTTDEAGSGTLVQFAAGCVPRVPKLQTPTDRACLPLHR